MPTKITSSYVTVARQTSKPRSVRTFLCDCGQVHRQSAERCTRCKKIPVPVSEAWDEDAEP